MKTRTADSHRSATRGSSRAPSPPPPEPNAVDLAHEAEIIRRGREVVRKEELALKALAERLGKSFARAVLLIAASKGRVIVAGVGKSGLVGRKLAATLTSTGTPASFLHPADSVHGDLGIVGTEDVVILVSKSGESAEVLALLDHVRRLGVHTIALVGELDSTLARNCDVALDVWVEEEACPHDLAPTTSTIATASMGDALAVALLLEKGFRREDFARLHPGGSLGKQLLTKVADVMVTGDLPVLPPEATMREGVVQLARGRGIVMVVDERGRLVGVVTTGDLTRLLKSERAAAKEWQEVDLSSVMSRRPHTVRSDELGSAAVFQMQSAGIMALPVLDADGRVDGVVHLHDLMRSGVA
jgi:arabinose-5-phosphate isomerase